MPTKLYSSPRWRRLRLQVLRRDGYRCVRCHTYVGGKGQARIDHIVPVKVAPHLTFDMANLRTFCPICDNHSHSEKAGNLPNVSRPGVRIDRIKHGFDESGMPRDPDHAWASKGGGP